ncbi:MAG: hypothetical protein CTY11_01380 [Methylomonas sp.]|nr:MAG: hypothetical protein CTY11_01380 [Methylomonas sp.]
MNDKDKAKTVRKGLYWIIVDRETRYAPWFLGRKKSYRLLPPTREQFIELAKVRNDLELRPSETGSKQEKDTLVVDPSGKAKGKLYLNSGECMIKNPDSTTLSWMIELAHELSGRVVDYAGRAYISPTEYYLHPEDKEVLENRGLTLPK